MPNFEAASGTGLLLTGDIATMCRVVDAAPGIRSVNVGGIHFRAGRKQRLRYVYLTSDEEQSLRDLSAKGVDVSAQDVPAASAIPLDELLEQEQAS